MTKDDVKRELSTIKKHYHREDVQMVMQYFADYKGYHKAGVYDDNGWYQYKAETRRLNDFADPADYQHLQRKTRRRILATLNYFRPETFQGWTPRDDESPGGFEDTIYLMLSVDIDLADNHTVQDPETLALLEKASGWFYQRLAAISGEYVLPLFSGNGVYLHLHPAIAYMHNNMPDAERRDNFDILTQCFNLRIQKLEAELYETYPDVIGVVKIDALNNRKRVFKAPLSLHKTLPYVVYPIDPANFKIPLKSLPLSPDDAEAASHMIHDFMDAEIIRADLDSMALYKLLLDDKEGIKTRRQEYKELNITPPDDAIPIDVILSEPVTAAIFQPESWSKGNTRRVAYMASLLSICGWIPNDIHEYIENQAGSWQVGAFSHVIDSWIGMHPPNIKTIYTAGNGYPGMNFGDCQRYLPDRPDYPNQIRIIFQKAREAGLDVSDPYPESEYYQDLDQNESPAETFTAEYEDQETILFYHTRHLGGYEDLRTSTGLYGDEYAIIWKTLWYQLMSYRIRTANIKMGRILVDGRINTLYPIKAGNGKGDLKRTIKSFVEYFLGSYGEPTSLHAEQLVGKTVKPRGKDEYEQRKGYLSDDWLVLDEAYEFLTSSELHYSEARKYLRVALDRYPGNTLHKRATDIGKVAPLEYEPICPVSILVQPKKFDDDRLILEGDLRRLMIPYVNMTGLSKTDAYLDNIFEDEPEADALIRFCQYIETLPRYDTFIVSTEARNIFAELFLDLITYANNYNPKIRSYAEIIGFTLQGHFLKMAAIQALQSGTNEIQTYHVELAYLDLFELMHHNYQFINNKVPGYLNYGEGWQGAEALDQELLVWLYSKGALTYETSIKGAEYVDQIMKKYDVKERRARDIQKKHQEHGWIVVKQVQHGSSVWLNFNPEVSRMQQNAECNGLKSKMSLSDEIVHNQISNNNYRYFNINYPILLDFQIQPPAFCNLEHSGKIITTNPASDPQQLDDHTLEVTSTTTTPHNPEQILMETYSPPIPSIPEDADMYEVALRGASQSFYQNSHWTGWTYTIPFLDQIEVATGIEDPEPLYQLKTRMIQEGYITQQGPQSEIRASDKLINLMKARGWDIVTSTPA